MLRILRTWLAMLLLAGACAAPLRAAAATDAGVPVAQVETLSGTPVELPQSLPSRPVLLVVGFSRSSREACRAWSGFLHGAGAPANVTVYQVAVLDDVPGLLRGLVVRGIRSGVPAPLHASFLLVTRDGDAWRRLAGYARPDAAYLLLLDAQHRLAWRYAGVADAAGKTALRRALADAVGTH